MAFPQQIGRYHIVEELGRGAMGCVLRAEDPTIRRQVAIKVISLAGGASSEEQAAFESSFHREIRSAGSLHHPGIISIFDAGRQDDLAYIVMELVDGSTFDALLQLHPRPEVPVLLRVCRQVAEALDYAHGRGIVHRDIKPANILVTAGGAARIADFGIARLPRGSATFSKTVVGAGTPEFMSPEQIEGKPLDGRTDQWSLAVMAYRVLTGAKPFRADQIAVILGQIMTVDPPPPSSVQPALPAAVDAVMAKALAKDPAARYTTCTEFIAELESAYHARQPQPMPSQSESPAAGIAPAVEPAPSRLPMIAAALVAMVAIAGGAFYWTHRQPPAPVSSAPTVTPAGAPAPALTPPGAKAAATLPAREMKPAPAISKTASAVKKIQQVRFTTTPPEADLIVDNKPDLHCQSPCSFELPEGPHTLLLKKDGYQTLFENIEVKADQPEISVALQQLAGFLLIDSDPPGAAISINGAKRAEVTPANLSLPPGKYQVRLTKDGFEPYDFETSVLAQATRESKVTLAKSLR